jgi:hypothetical protein
MAERAVQVYGAPCVGSDPHVALGELLDLSRGHVKWLAGVIAAFSDSAQLKQYAGSEDGLLWERPSVWVDLYDRERRHLESIAKTCAAVGVEERRIQLAEGQGALIAQAIQGVLTEVGVVLSPEVRGIVRRHLLAVSAGTVEGTAGDA